MEMYKFLSSWQSNYSRETAKPKRLRWESKGLIFIAVFKTNLP